MIYYNNNYLSIKLSINKSKWKRWVREFLPADPLGGRQSGYARQLNLKDGFKVFLAGYLVSKLKFSVPEAQLILFDLSAWLRKNGFYNLQLLKPADNGSGDLQYRVYVLEHPKEGFIYAIRGVLDAPSELEPGRSQRIERFELTLIGTDRDELIADGAAGARVVALTNLYHRYCAALQEFG